MKRLLLLVACAIVASPLLLSASSSGDIPCTVSWQPVSGSDAWEQAANWSTGAVPTTTDVVCIGAGQLAVVRNASARVRALQSDGTVRINGADLTVLDADVPSRSAGLQISGGAFDGSGDMTVNGSFVWTSGPLRGSGRLVIAPDATGVFLLATQVTWDARRLVNHGSVTMTQLNGGYVYASNGATLDNDGTFRANAEYFTPFYFNGVGARPRILNSGTFAKTSGVGETAIMWALDNDGTVQAQTGRLAFSGGGIDGESSTGTISGPGAVRLAGGGGSIAALRWSTPLRIAADGHAELTSGSFSAPAVDSTGELSLTGGTLELTEPHATGSRTGRLVVAGGTLDGPGTVTATDTFAWTGGGLAGSGDLILGPASTATLAINGSGAWSARRLVNQGTATMTAGYLYASNGATLVNEGTFRANSEYFVPFYYNGAGARPRILNSGTFTKTTGTGEGSIQWALDNDGTLEAQTGRLAFSGGGIDGESSTGTISGPGTVRLAGGGGSIAALHWSTPLRIAADGHAELASGTFTAPAVDSTGELSLTGGTLELTDPDATSSTTIRLVIAGGTLDGAGTLTATDTFAWTGGGLAGSGDLILGPASTAALAINGSGAWSQRRLVNHGTATMTAGYLYASNGATLDNDGTFRANSEYFVPFYYNGAGARPQIHNTGTFAKTTGTGEGSIQWALDNDGTLEAQTGRLAFSGGGIDGQPSTGTISGPGTVRLNGGGGSIAALRWSAPLQVAANGHAELASGSFSATAVDSAGELSLTGGTLELTEPQAAGSHTSRLVIAGGTLDGAGTLTATDTFAWTGGGLAGSGDLILGPASTATLAINGSGIWSQRQLVNHGTATMTSGYLYASNGATLVNQGTFRANSEYFVPFYYNGAGARPRIRNSGTFTKTTGTGEGSIMWALDNDGTLEAQTGRLAFSGGGIDGEPSTGTISGPGAVRLTGGSGSIPTLRWSTPLRVAANGHAEASGTFTAPAVDSTGELSLTGGTLQLTDPDATSSTTTRLVIAGGTLDGPGTLTATDTFAWTGGGLAGSGDLVLGPASTATLAINGSGIWSQRQLVNHGTATMTAGYLYASNGATLDNDGTFRANSEYFVPFYYNGAGARPQIHNTGTFAKTTGTGEGSIQWALDNDGVLDVQTGRLAFTSAIAYQTPDGVLRVRIAGRNQASEYGAVTVGGTARLNGRLDIQTAPDFTPAAGDSFRVLGHGARSGDFREITGTELPGGLRYAVRYASDGVYLDVVASPASAAHLRAGDDAASRAAPLQGRAEAAAGAPVRLRAGAARRGAASPASAARGRATRRPARSMQAPKVDGLVATTGDTEPADLGVTLHGSVEARGDAVSWFQYGLGGDLGLTTPHEPGASEDPVAVSARLGDLLPGMSYSYRVVARSRDGVTEGATRTFTAPVAASAPLVVTDPATHATPTSTALNATIDPRGAATTYHFEYGLTDRYGSRTDDTPTGDAAAVAAAIAGLAPDTTYHFRVVATNADGTTAGEDMAITTPRPPQRPTIADTAVSEAGAGSALARATIGPEGRDGTFRFEYGTTGDYGHATAPAPTGSSGSPTVRSIRISGLAAGTTYHVRAVARNDAGETRGAVVTLTTAPASEPGGPDPDPDPEPPATTAPPPVLTQPSAPITQPSPPIAAPPSPLATQPAPATPARPAGAARARVEVPSAISRRTLTTRGILVRVANPRAGASLVVRCTATGRRATTGSTLAERTRRGVASGRVDLRVRVAPSKLRRATGMRLRIVLRPPHGQALVFVRTVRLR